MTHAAKVRDRVRRAPAAQRSEAGLSFSVRLTPKGGRDAIDGWISAADGTRMLRVRVAAPPEDGKANESLLVLLSRVLDIPKSRLAIRVGATHRTKLIAASGNSRELSDRLHKIGEAS